MWKWQEVCLVCEWAEVKIVVDEPDPPCTIVSI